MILFFSGLLFLVYGGINGEHTEFEWLFDDHVDENSAEEVRANVASSIEDLAAHYRYEQEMILSLIDFSDTVKNEGLVDKSPNIKKLVRSVDN